MTYRNQSTDCACQPKGTVFHKACTYILTVCLAFSIVLVPVSAQEAKPNVFLITIDTLRADHVHCYGYDKIQTPALDTLVQDGIRFAKAFTPSPTTDSSHTTILTGLLPSSHGVTDFGIPLDAAHATWAEILKTHGYHTAAFIGAIVLDSKSLAPGLDRGFDFYDNFPTHAATTSRWGQIERRGMTVVTHAESWLAAHPQGPHFVWVHLYDPHDPYEPPPPYSHLYKDHLYDGEIAYADSAVGHFIRYLKHRSLYNNSLIIVVGDHGEGLGEHHEATHGVFLYDSTTHVPLIMKLPTASKAGMAVNEQVRTTDILPTVLDLLAIPSSAKFDGTSLKPSIEGSEADDRILYGETDYPIRFGWAPLRSVRTDHLKFIEAPRPEFYNLQTDPEELHNSYQPWEDSIKQLRTLLAEERSKFPTHPSQSTTGSGTLDELKALGYLGPADANSATNVPEPSLLPDAKDHIEEQNLLHDAMLASEENHPEAAAVSLEKLLQLNPNSVAALHQLGELELRDRQYQQAANHLRRAHAIAGADSSTTNALAEALTKTGDLKSAQSLLEESLKADPTQLQARLSLGDIFIQLGNDVGAKDQFQAAQLLDPANMRASLGIARAEIAQRDFSSAVDGLHSLSLTHPKNPAIFELMAQAYRGLNKPRLAQQAEVRAKQLHFQQHKANE